VALSLWKINRGQLSSTGQPMRILALHLEVDCQETHEGHKKITAIYAPNAQEFPLGIHMRLVPEIHTLHNAMLRIKVSELQTRQRQFLIQTETQLLNMPKIDLLLPENQYVDINRFQDLIMATPHPVKASQRLFLAVSMQATKNAFLLRYRRQHCTSAQTANQRIVNMLGWACNDAHNDTHQLAVSIASNHLTHTTIPSQVNYTPKERIIQKVSLGAVERLPHPKHEEATSTPFSEKGLLYHCDVHQYPFATSNGESRCQLEAILRRLLKTAWDVWRYRNGVQPDLTQKPDPAATLPQWLPHLMLPRPTSHQSVQRWLTAFLQHHQDTAWDRWRYRNGVQSVTQQFAIFTMERLFSSTQLMPSSYWNLL